MKVAERRDEERGPLSLSPALPLPRSEIFHTVILFSPKSMTVTDRIGLDGSCIHRHPIRSVTVCLAYQNAPAGQCAHCDKECPDLPFEELDRSALGFNVLSHNYLYRFCILVKFKLGWLSIKCRCHVRPANLFG